MYVYLTSSTFASTLSGSLVNFIKGESGENTSIQYEVNQLKMMNKRLHDEVLQVCIRKQALK